MATTSALTAAERGRAQALLKLRRDSMQIAPGRDLTLEADSLIQGSTGTRSFVLYYMVTGDMLLVWLIEPTAAVHVDSSIVARDTLADLVAQLRRELGADYARGGLVLEPDEGQGPGGFYETTTRWPTATGRRLSDLLLPAAFRSLVPDSAELVVIPHGVLNLVPFTALPLNPVDVAGSPSASELLSDRYAIQYAPSLRILGEVQERSSGGGDPLIVGNPVMPSVTFGGQRKQLRPLAGADDEAEWVGDQLGVHPLKGPKPTESLIRELLPEAWLVHLATHGYAYASEARARESYVALAPDEVNDGHLTVGEVLDEVGTLKAELVVLSACQTGLGDLKEAEGTVGLQRAFLAKGARSVLVSLWSVSDKATELLVKRFYTHLLGIGGRPRVSKAESLRRAQNDVRATWGYEHPRFWAAFQLVGAG